MTTPWPDPRRRVLVMDADPGTRLVLGRLLGRLGYDVHLTATTEEATAALAADPTLDAVISETTDPELSATKLTNRLRRDHPRLPLLLLTTTPPPGRLGGQGLTRVLRKPLTPAALAGHLEDLLTAADAHRRPPTSTDHVDHGG